MAKKKFGSDIGDSFPGTNGNDRYDGRAGNDGINGGDGNDKLWGSAGYDIITGGAGKDLLWGGTEADSFVFQRGGRIGFGSETDIIKDLDFKTDEIDHIQIMNIDSIDIISSLSELMKYAHKDGSDLRFSFGHGDVLVIEDIKKSQIPDDLFIFS